MATAATAAPQTSSDVVIQSSWGSTNQALTPQLAIEKANIAASPRDLENRQPAASVRMTA